MTTRQTWSRCGLNLTKASKTKWPRTKSCSKHKRKEGRPAARAGDRVRVIAGGLVGCRGVVEHVCCVGVATLNLEDGGTVYVHVTKLEQA